MNLWKQLPCQHLAKTHVLFDCIADNSKQSEINLQVHDYFIAYTVAVHK